MFRGNKIRHLVRDERGMTLMDMAIALLVLGLIAAPLVQAYNIWQIESVNGETMTGIFSARAAAEDFYYNNDRYVCPADPALGPGDPNYGVEDCTATTEFTNVRAGAIPFVTLKIPEEASLDGFGHKMTYVVTKVQTVAPLNPLAGVIDVQGYDVPGIDQCGTSLISYGNTTHFVIISHGEKGIGAYTANGTMIEACPVGMDWTLESENCTYDDDTLFADTCATSYEEGPDYYDDVVFAQYSTPSRIWTYSDADPDDMFSSAGNIGINNLDPQVALDVVGNIYAETNATDPEKEGNSNSSEICDPDGNNCFSAAIIAGTQPEMDCSLSGTGNVGVHIKNAALGCIQKFRSDQASSCPAGTYGVGFLADGSLDCQ